MDNKLSRPSTADSSFFSSHTATPSFESEWKEMSKEQKLKQIRQELAPHQIQEFRTTFNEFDKNGDGTISMNELRVAFSRLGFEPSDEELQTMIANVDEDNNGEVEWLEFLQLMYLSLSDTKLTDDELREAFKAFDKDGSGKVSPGEVQAIMKKFGEDWTLQQVTAMLQEMTSEGEDAGLTAVCTPTSLARRFLDITPAGYNYVQLAYPQPVVLCTRQLNLLSPIKRQFM